MRSARAFRHVRSLLGRASSERAFSGGVGIADDEGPVLSTLAGAPVAAAVGAVAVAVAVATCVVSAGGAADADAGAEGD